MADVIVQQGVRTPPRHILQISVLLEVLFALLSMLSSLLLYEISPLFVLILISN
jgi:hypothetical protein